ncbi:hypothetical protein BCR42DRAFT_474035 [Absidia repens]|uniref:G-protein coupled receptors family 1 profile domain-containing protein n=1 Tax=Absidia repens TaxID=90262 RepID=A0A1X2HZW2_9FUNG|nr:hypothetical protein BCR42DRAFT_474035 [Absidia repens]
MEKIKEADAAPTLPPTQFHYTVEQFMQLKLASEICTILSMIAIAIVGVIYIYMLFYHPREVNRVSLRCVIGANTISFVDHCMALKASHDKLETAFCHSFRILDGIFTVMSSCLLGMVGVHLFLVFVCHVHWPCRPDYILIPVAAFYSILANIVPFFNESLPAGFKRLIDADNSVCWYYNAFLDRTYNKTSWIYYYCFMFFIIVVAFFSSVAAMYKVYSDKTKNEQVMLQINSRGIGAPSPSTNDDASVPITTHNQLSSGHSKRHIHQRDSNPIRKIVARSLLYPLMPALTYSLGFALQMYLVNPNHTANYAFVMVSNVLARLAGVFTAMIFFADPAVQKIPYEIWSKCTKRTASTRPTTKPNATNHSDPPNVYISSSSIKPISFATQN